MLRGEKVDMLSPTAVLEENTTKMQKPWGTVVQGSHLMKVEVGRRKMELGLEGSLLLATVCG